MPLIASAQGVVAQGTLNADTPGARMLSPGTEMADLARIDITALNGIVYLRSIQIGTDIAGGLQNFTEIRIYNATTNAIVANYPSPSTMGDTVEFVTISIPQNVKTFVIRGTIASIASGVVRVGFKDISLQDGATVEKVGLPVYGNTITFPGATPTPTPSVSVTPTPTPTPIATPLMFSTLEALGLREGDTISATNTSDPDIYIANAFGYKRLFLNPAIFNFYGHLGGFANVKSVAPSTRDVLVTSGLYRNCETNDQKVYGVEITGEDTGILHWIDTSGREALEDDSDFFKKVFCINTNEFNWYAKGSAYTSVNQIPSYAR